MQPESSTQHIQQDQPAAAAVALAASTVVVFSFQRVFLVAVTSGVQSQQQCSAQRRQRQLLLQEQQPLLLSPVGLLCSRSHCLLCRQLLLQEHWLQQASRRYCCCCLMSSSPLHAGLGAAVLPGHLQRRQQQSGEWQYIAQALNVAFDTHATDCRLASMLCMRRFIAKSLVEASTVTTVSEHIPLALQHQHEHCLRMGWRYQQVVL